ncbi:MAG: ArnT family glycosyltransferase [Planctomycetota bacterium]|jgi:hypothetical protein
MNDHVRTGRRLAPAVLVVLFLTATLGPVLAGFDRFPEKSIDHDFHHVPVVLAFADTLPAVDLADYDSATTPGMHLLLAVAVRMFGPSETLLQVCACGFGVLLLVVAYRYAAKAVTPWTAFFCTLPLASSPYVLGNSIWVMTDNLSLALIAISAGSAIFCVASRGRAVGSGIALVCSVLVRQINIWVSGVALLAFLFQWDPIRRRLPFRDPLQPGHRGLQPAVIFAIATVVAASVIAGFVMLWGGLVPPKFQIGGDGVTHHGGLNHGVTPGVLSLLAVYASPLVVVLVPFWWNDRRIRGAMVIGLVIGERWLALVVRRLDAHDPRSVEPDRRGQRRGRRDRGNPLRTARRVGPISNRLVGRGFRDLLRGRLHRELVRLPAVLRPTRAARGGLVPRVARIRTNLVRDDRTRAAPTRRIRRLLAPGDLRGPHAVREDGLGHGMTLVHRNS